MIRWLYDVCRLSGALLVNSFRLKAAQAKRDIERRTCTICGASAARGAAWAAMCDDCQASDPSLLAEWYRLRIERRDGPTFETSRSWSESGAAKHIHTSGVAEMVSDGPTHRADGRHTHFWRDMAQGLFVPLSWEDATLDHVHKYPRSSIPIKETDAEYLLRTGRAGDGRVVAEPDVEESLRRQREIERL